MLSHLLIYMRCFSHTWLAHQTPSISVNNDLLQLDSVYIARFVRARLANSKSHSFRDRTERMVYLTLYTCIYTRDRASIDT